MIKIEFKYLLSGKLAHCFICMLNKAHLIFGVVMNLSFRSFSYRCLCASSKNIIACPFCVIFVAKILSQMKSDNYGCDSINRLILPRAIIIPLIAQRLASH